MEKIHTEDAPPPAGHYSQAVVHNGLAFVAGQLPVDASRRSLADESVADQTRAVFGNIATILGAAGSGLEHLLQVTIYVTDMALWSEVNEAYATLMGDHKPARAVVPVNELHHGVALEVQVIAAVP